MTTEPRRRWVVDAMNVIGSRPDGWWRDRAGAMRALVADLRRFQRATGDPVRVVVEGSVPEDLEDEAGDEVEVVAARRRGRDAADDRIVELVRDDGERGSVTVVTSDRDLAQQVEALGAATEGAGSFRRRLDDLDAGS